MAQIFHTSKQTIHPNIKNSFLFTFFHWLGYGIWSSSTFTVFIFKQSDNSNITVGGLEAAQGLSQVIGAILFGVLSDRYERHQILRFSSVFGTFATCLWIYSIHVIENVSFFYFINCIWGFYLGSFGPALEAIFADSITDENRTKMYYLRRIAQAFGMTGGPLINVYLYHEFGNDWEIDVLRKIMTFGFSLNLISCFFLILFRKSDEVSKTETFEILDEKNEAIELNELEKLQKEETAFKVRWLMIVTLLVFMLGSGLSLKFFPLFFLNEFNIEPLTLNVTLALIPMLTSLFLYLSLRITTIKISRITVLIILNYLVISCFIILGTVPILSVALPIFILRNTFGASMEPHEKAIIMEYAPKENRGKWGAFESLISSVWAGSAAIGGVLIEHTSYRFCFLLTAGIYFFAGFFFKWIGRIVKH